MRTKKQLLLIDDKEIRRSTWAYALTIRSYRVLSVSGSQIQDALALDKHFDAVLVQCDLETIDSFALTVRLKEMDATRAVVLMGEEQDTSKMQDAADYFFGKQHSRAELLEKLRCLCALKPGPKPGSVPVLPRALEVTA